MQPNSSVKSTIYAIISHEEVETTGFPMITDLDSVSKSEGQSKRSVPLDSRPTIIGQTESHTWIRPSLLNLKHLSLS